MKNNNEVYKKTSLIVCKTLTVDQVDIDKDLFESGLLDSLTLIQLMMELEEGFEITITPEEMNVEDYKTVRAMAKMIVRIKFSTTLSNHG